MPHETLGMILRQLREKIDLSLRDFAKRIKVSPPFWSDVELGRRFPSDDVLARAAKELDVRTEDLKKYDQRETVLELKKYVESSPALGLAFRTQVDDLKKGKITPEQLAERLNKTHKQ